MISSKMNVLHYDVCWIEKQIEMILKWNPRHRGHLYIFTRDRLFEHYIIVRLKIQYNYEIPTQRPFFKRYEC